MSSTQAQTTALVKFDSALRAYLDALQPVPDESLDYRPPEEDYALGGLAHHVNGVLVHYRNTLEAVIRSEFEETAPAEPADLLTIANRKASAGLRPDERKAVLAETEALHAEVRRTASGLSAEDFERKAPVRFEAGAKPYPTSAADVLDWLTGHYEEHIPQIGQLLATWSCRHV